MSRMFTAKVVQDPRLGVPTVRLRYESPTRGIRVEIVPAFGSNMYRYRVDNTELIYCNIERLKHRDWTGTFVLWPLPNRVRDKQFEFEGHVQSLKAIVRREGNEPLIHGLVDDQPWNLGKVTTDASSACAQTWIEITPQSPLYRHFPYPSKLTLDFVLTERGIRISYTVKNNGSKNMPFGFALHPYFALLSGATHTLVTLPADSIMEADDELLPTGRLLPMGAQEYDVRLPTAVSELELDHVFTELHPGAVARIDYPRQNLALNLRASSDFTHLVLYTLEADKGFICFENQTGSTDMINLHAKAQQRGDQALAKAAHLLVLPPRAKHQGFIAYEVVRRTP